MRSADEGSTILYTVCILEFRNRLSYNNVRPLSVLTASTAGV